MKSDHIEKYIEEYQRELAQEIQNEYGALKRPPDQLDSCIYLGGSGKVVDKTLDHPNVCVKRGKLCLT